MTDAKPEKGSGGWLLILGVLGLLFLVGMCSSSDDDTAPGFASQSLSQQIAAMPAPTEVVIAPLSSASVRKARRHLDAVIAAEGLSGAMIYSQNCYDALSHAFSWARLDQCGGFDLLAVSAVDTTSVSGLATEVAYFGSEEAAGRYLALAIKGGQVPGEADLRWSQLEQEANKLAPVSVVETPTPSETTEPIDVDEDIPLELEGGVEESA
jgi:hypothetical protein